MKSIAPLIARILPGCAGMLTVLALFAAQPARADIVTGDDDPVKCGPATPFGFQCANVSFTATATTPGFATVGATTSILNPLTAPNGATAAAVSLASPQVGTAASSVTFGKERGIPPPKVLGADVSIPHAYWILTGGWCWNRPGLAAPLNCNAFNGGAFVYFNTIGTPPIGFANALIIGDPFSFTEVQSFVTSLGGDGAALVDMGVLTPNATTGVVPIPQQPGDHFGLAPEPSYFVIESLAAAGLILAVWRRRCVRA
jgi:hypothetical protein